MNHLDEGTIHAWLDGALDARGAADAQAHVNQCAGCAAQVAEARGLIAASSRILTALDDVPAGVTPKRAAPAPKMRRWTASPWITGVAAALVIVALWRTSDMDRSVPSAKVATDMAIPQVKALESAPPSLAPVPVPQQIASTPATSGAQSLSRAGRGARADSAASFGARTGAGAGGSVLGETRQRLEATAPASAPPPAPAVAAAAVAADTRDRAERLEAKAAKDAVEESAPWGGCYRLSVATRQQTEAVTTANVASESRSRTARRASPSAAPPAAAGAAAAPTAQRAAFSDVAAPAMIRLDTIARDPGFAVRSVTSRSDSTIGVWRELSADSARVELPSRGVFTIAKKDRVACP